MVGFNIQILMQLLLLAQNSPRQGLNAKWHLNRSRFGQSVIE